SFHENPSDFVAADRAFEATFADFDLDVNVLTAKQVADRICATKVKNQLVAALGFWIYVKECLPASTSEGLRAIERSIDDDAWRSELRAPGVLKDRSALK